MKNFRNKTAQITLGALLYSAWVILNAQLLHLSSPSKEFGSPYWYFFPFNHGISDTCLWGYDVTEFILYTVLLPVLVVFIFKYVLPNYKGPAPKRRLLIGIVWGAIVYCFALAIAATFDDSDLIGLFFAIIKGLAICLFAYYATHLVIDYFFPPKKECQTES